MTFLTKKMLTRRTVLKGVGATVALPLLDAALALLSDMATFEEAGIAGPTTTTNDVLRAESLVQRDERSIRRC